MSRDWTEQQIAAHVDGSLDPEEDARVRDAIARDPEARASAERLRVLNGVLGAAYPLPSPEIPDRIAAALAAEPGRVVALPARRGTRWAQFAAAASVALAIGIGAGFLLGDAGRPSSDAVLADAGPALELALETVPSGGLSEAGVRPLSTFRAADGQPCREFETSGPLPARVGVACREPEGDWDVVAIVALPKPAEAEGAGFAPASGAEEQALDLALDAIGAGPPLAPSEEAALIGSEWSSP